jgi:hypothetical protein
LDGFGNVTHAAIAVHAADLQFRHGEILSRAVVLSNWLKSRGSFSRLTKPSTPRSSFGLDF